ncbi:MAG: hypothetical protein ACRBN8_08950 [Nannocystales bacterium]
MAFRPKSGIKGSMLREFVVWYSEANPGKLQQVIEGLSEELQAPFDPAHPTLGMLPSRWYPAPAVHAVIDSMLDGMLARDVNQLAQMAGATTVARMKDNGVYNLFFRWVLRPSNYSKIIQAMWTLNYDSGRLETIDHGPCRQEGRVHDWNSHHPFLCRTNIAVKRSVWEAMGCIGARIEEQFCISDGAPYCGSVISWQPGTPRDEPEG